MVGEGITFRAVGMASGWTGVESRWRRRCGCWTSRVRRSPSWVWSLTGDVRIYLLNRLLHYYFYRQRNAEGLLPPSCKAAHADCRSETQLRTLLAEQRKQLDSIKKATNYDSTRKLIERYDETGPPQMGRPMTSRPSTPTREAPESPSPAGRGTPRAPGHLVGAGGTPGRMSLSPGKTRRS